MRQWILAAALSVLAGGSVQAAEPPEGTMDYRWLGNAGFQVFLSSGAHVLVDPWLDSGRVHPLPLADIEEEVDYILITHIHGDHADDIGAIQEKFPGVRIFVGTASAETLVRWQNLDTSRLYKVSDGQKFEFDDVTIQAFAGRHTESVTGNFLEWDDHGRMTPSSAGTFDLYQFYFEAPDTVSMAAWAGTPSVDNANRLKGLEPDVAAVHISPKQDYEILGRIIDDMGPKVVVPHHFDLWPNALTRRPEIAAEFPDAVQPVTPENVIDKALPYAFEQISLGGADVEFFRPDVHVWYRYDQATGESTRIER